jgi:O-antigen ligase
LEGPNLIEKKLMASNWESRPGALDFNEPAGVLRSFLRGTISALAVLYMISLTCSMAAMEITSWALFLAFALYLLATDGRSGVKFQVIGVEIPLAILASAGILGLILHTGWSEGLYGAGRMRNLILLFTFAFALQLIKKLHRLVVLLMICGTIVAVYAIWQHYSGIDLWRHNHRALWPDAYGSTHYASIGLFNHHLTYGHSFVMILAIPWAMLLLMRKSLNRWQIAGVTASFALLFTSLIFTYGRGVWIAMVVGLLVMTAFVSRKLVAAVLVGVAIIGIILFDRGGRFHNRVISMVGIDTGNRGDMLTISERQQLWMANFLMFEDHPLVGVGYSNNEALTPEYYKRMGVVDGLVGHAHNNYIQMLSTTGIIGFTAYMAFIILFLMMTFELYRAIPVDDLWGRMMALAAFGAQISFHVGGLTQFNFGDMKVQHQFIFWLALVACLRIKYGLRSSLWPLERINARQ